MKNLKISAKLLVSFGGVILMILILGFASLKEINTINQVVTLYAEKTVPNSETIGEIRQHMMEVERDLVEAIATADKADRDALFIAVTEGFQGLKDHIAIFNSNTRTDPKLMEEFVTRLDRAAEYRKEIVNLLNQSYNDATAQQALNIYKKQYVPAYQNAGEALDVVLAEVSRLAKKQSTDAVRTVYEAKTLVFVIGLLSVGFTALMVMLIRRSLLEPVNQIRKVVDNMASGKLEADFTYQSKDEFGSLAGGLVQSVQILKNYITDIRRAMNEMSKGNFNVAPSQPFMGDFKQIEDSISGMISHVSSTLTQVDQIADHVSNEANQVAAYSQALAQGTEEQASSVQELSAAIADISERVRKNADDTQKVDHIVVEAVALMRHSNDQMQELLQSIHEIDMKSQEVRKINKAIEDIAFQTNILALNAAVEAARAGSAGKGFAVVADEVRNLAAKSAEAAQNTTTLIEGTVAASAVGVKHTAETAEQLDKAVASVLSAAELITGITASSEVQAQAVEQITIGLAQVSSVVHSNSASSEESAAASQELSSQAEHLKQMMGTFALKNMNGM